MFPVTFILLEQNKERERKIVQIYKDDTLENVKYKLSEQLDSKQIEGYYLFYKKTMLLNPYDSFKKLSNQNTRVISYPTFYGFCVNHGLELPEKKEVYELEDFLQYDQQKVETTLPIGIKKQSPFIVNPYENIFPMLEDSNTLSNSLWLGLPKEVYVCQANDVYAYWEEKKYEIGQMANVYFPYLFEKKVNTSAELSALPLVEYTQYKAYNDMIDYHHSIHQKDHLIQHGIKSIYFVLYTLQPFRFPSEMVFKMIQTDMMYPFVKLTGSRKQDNMYRLFCDGFSIKGKKTPAMPRKMIQKYSSECKRLNTLSYLFYYKPTQSLVLTIDEHGHIFFQLEPTELITVIEIETLIKEITANVLSQLSEKLDPTHHIFDTFQDLYQDTVEIIDLQYSFHYKRYANLNIKKFMKCFSPVFNFIEEKGTTTLRYKRVSNFNTMESMDSFLTEKINKQMPYAEMVHLFSVNFMNNDEPAAIEYIGKFMSHIQVEQDMKVNRIRKLKVNPGFLVEVDKHDTSYEVVVHSIDNMYYLTCIEPYVTNLMMISQGLIDVGDHCEEVAEVMATEVEVEVDEEDFQMEPDDTLDHFSDSDQELEGSMSFSNTGSEPSAESTEETKQESSNNSEPEAEPEKVQSQAESEAESEAEQSQAEQSQAEQSQAEQSQAEQSEAEGTMNNGESEAESEAEPEAEQTGEQPEAEQTGEEPAGEPEAEPEAEQTGEEPGEPEAEQTGEQSDAEGTIKTEDSEAEPEEEQTGEQSDAEGTMRTEESEAESEAEPEEEQTGEQSDAEGTMRTEESDAESETEPNEEIDLNAPEPNEVDLNAPEKQTGGSNEKDVFIYDDHYPFDITQTLGLTPELYPAELKHYFRAFHASGCALVQKQDTSCKGFVAKLTPEQIAKFPFLNTLEEVSVYDKAGNYNKVWTAFNPVEAWTTHPSLTVLKKVYSTVAYGWKNKMDDQGILYIYDKDYRLHGRFNNVHYVKVEEEDDDLTKIRFTPMNPFLKKLQQREPVLFHKSSDGVHSQYSRMCLWSAKRQPVILTEKEKERIDSVAPNAYDSSLKYGSDPDNPFYYICPRYWDLKHNLPVKADSVDKSKLIPKDIPDRLKHVDIQSRYIMDLSVPGDDKTFMTRVGMLKSKSPDGHYLPCCFTTRSAGKKEDEVDKRTKDAMGVKSAKKEPTQSTVQYIQNGDKFPLENGRRGHLTPILERFFHTNYADYYSNLQKRKLKTNYPCLLRRGVENNKHQSFLYAISFLLHKNEVSLDTFKKEIIAALNLDILQTLHQGNIPHTFSSLKYEDQDLEPYKETTLYKTMMDNPMALKKIVNGYENFIKYIESDEPIDYVYFWDIFCAGLLTKTRINLVILQEDVDDATHNISILCPTTLHSIYSFDLSLPTAILYKRGEFFEPIYIYTEKEAMFTQTKLLEPVHLTPTLKHILSLISKNMEKCIPQKNKYQYKDNLPADQILEILKGLPYKVRKGLINVDARMVALQVEYKKYIFMVPCAPSPISLPYEMLTAEKGHDYRTTLSLLNRLYKDSKQKIPCRPTHRIVEDELVVGILTETNQFVPLIRPEENKMTDELHVLHDHSYLDYDVYISKHPQQPFKHKLIHYLKLEQGFYRAFFNTLKMAIHDTSFYSTRNVLESIIHSKDDYETKNEDIYQVLKPIFVKKFDFVVYQEKVLDELADINLCKDPSQNYCEFETPTSEGKLLIPKLNLFDQSDNYDRYVNRLIDDMIENRSIQKSLFTEIHSTLYYSDLYHLSSEEILLLENNLLSYLDENPKIKKIKSITHRAFEDVQPRKVLELLEPYEEVEELKEESIFLETEEVYDSDTEENANLTDDSEEGIDTTNTLYQSIKTEKKEDIHVETPNPYVEPPIEVNLNAPVETNLNAPEPEVPAVEPTPVAVKRPETAKPVTKAEIQSKGVESEFKECMKVVYLTQKWINYFPKGTKTLRFMNTPISCNGMLLLQIYRDYNPDKYRHITIENIKEKLVHTYQKYETFYQFLYKKWKAEKPPEYQNKTLSMTSMIQNEEYPITQVDLCLLLFDEELPITLLLHSKGSVKCVRRIGHQQDFSYYVKLTDSDTFFLFIYHKETYKIYDQDISEDFQADIKENSMTVLNYLKSNI